MNWTVTVDGRVLVEIVSHRQAHEDREAKNEIGSEAVQVAKLKKTHTYGACSAWDKESKILLLD